MGGAVDGAKWWFYVVVKSSSSCVRHLCLILAVCSLALSPWETYFTEIHFTTSVKISIIIVNTGRVVV